MSTKKSTDSSLKFVDNVFVNKENVNKNKKIQT